MKTSNAVEILKNRYQEKYQDHPIAEIYPLMSKEELKELAEDVKKQGLLKPIVLYEDKILDGRNRYRACEIAGVDPCFETFSGDSPTAYVISMNAKRRHLTSSQRAAAAVLAEPHFAEEAKKRQQIRKGNQPGATTPKLAELKGESREQAASAFGVSHGYVSAAKKLKQEKPEVFQQVHSGEKSLQEARREIAVTTGFDAPPQIDESKISDDSFTLQQLKHYWKRASKADKKTFKKWINSGDQQ